MVLLHVNQMSDRQYDIVIVGAGAAGYTIANEFKDSKLSVALLEGGEYDYTAKSQAIYNGTIGSGLIHADLDVYRQRHLGGSTNCWGGGCLPFDRIDFEGREELGLPKWPIEYDEILPFYDRAAKYTGTETFDGNFSGANKRIPIFPEIENQDILLQKHWRVNNSKRNFRDNFHDTLINSKNIDVYLNANVISLNMQNGSNIINSLGVQGLDSIKTKLTGKKFILCCGGLETTRLMLNWTESSPELFLGLKKSLGHYYSPHINLYNGLFVPENGIEIKNDYFPVTDKIRERAFISFSEKHLKENKLLNFKTTFESVSSLDEKARNFDNVLKFIANKNRLSNVNVYNLNTAFDQSPNYDSKIYLNSNRDDIGLKRITLEHQISESDVKSINMTYFQLAKTFGSLGLGRLAYKSAESCFETEVIGKSHHTGTTRMSSTTDEGVVDSNLKVHGMHNLYISSSSIFPTPSQANPTLTIMAFSIRLADFLKGSMTL